MVAGNASDRPRLLDGRAPAEHLRAAGRPGAGGLALALADRRGHGCDGRPTCRRCSDLVPSGAWRSGWRRSWWWPRPGPSSPWGTRCSRRPRWSRVWPRMCRPTAHLFVRLRVLHPVLAVLASIYLLVVLASLASRDPAGQLRALAMTAAALVLAQVGLGLLNFALLAPTALQILHLLLADLLWLSLVVLAALVREQTASATTPGRRAGDPAVPAQLVEQQLSQREPSSSPLKAAKRPRSAGQRPAVLAARWPAAGCTWRCARRRPDRPGAPKRRPGPPPDRPASRPRSRRRLRRPSAPGRPGAPPGGVGGVADGGQIGRAPAG